MNEQNALGKGCESVGLADRFSSSRMRDKFFKVGKGDEERNSYSSNELKE